MAMATVRGNHPSSSMLLCLHVDSRSCRKPRPRRNPGAKGVRHDRRHHGHPERGRQVHHPIDAGGHSPVRAGREEGKGLRGLSFPFGVSGLFTRQ